MFIYENRHFLLNMLYLIAHCLTGRRVWALNKVERGADNFFGQKSILTCLKKRERLHMYPLRFKIM